MFVKKDQIKSPCRKMWHISNQMPYIYLFLYIESIQKLYHGFKSVPRKKDTFKNHTLIYYYYYFDPLFERAEAHGGQPQKCSNLEQITLEVGEPELSVIKWTYQIKSI